jgi:acyl-CoA thioester hydrolase
MVPYRTALVPDARVEAMPPIEASAPGSIGILDVDIQDTVHVAEIDANAAGRRVDLPLERGAGTERDHRHAVGRADPDHVLNVGCLLRHHHRVGRLRRQPCHGVGVLVADCLRGDEPVAEPRGERFNRAGQRLRFRMLQIEWIACVHVSSSQRQDRGKGCITGQANLTNTIVDRSSRGSGMTMDATAGLPLQVPFLTSVMQIEPQWIDYNGHLNMAYYNVLFDRAIDELWLQIGIGPEYMKTRGGSTFTAECHVRYLREIHLGDPVQVSIVLVAADEKRMHTFEELHHATEGWLSATSENMTLHMDMTARKTAPFPPDIRARIAALAETHAACPRPDGMGRKISMPAR